MNAVCAGFLTQVDNCRREVLADIFLQRMLVSPMSCYRDRGSSEFGEALFSGD